MPINPNLNFIPIASIMPETLDLIVNTFNQGVYSLAGLMCALIFAVTWKG